MKMGFWRQDWFLGLLSSVLFIYIANSNTLRSLERSAHGAGHAPTGGNASDRLSVLTFVSPEWSPLAEYLAFACVALFLVLLIPRLNTAVAALVSFTLLTVLLGINQFFIVSQATWIELTYPAILLTGGSVLIISKRLLTTTQADTSSVQKDQAIAMAYQQQGQLDLAFEKYRQQPLHDSIMEPLYSLANAYESKNELDKALSVLEYMATHDVDFRDVREKIKRFKTFQQTMVFGSPSAGHVKEYALDGDDVGNSMLGRYEVSKVLGKGAMGEVYLGKDPKINRTVAIKTLALSREFEEDELDQVKERFFREAESAGRLTHPNIVTIYDVGEDQELAYIAMEFLNGHDLIRYTRPNKLLPIANVLQIIILAAEALNYAHEQNVVHRDIKPANVMLLPESATIKLTDFGIARITDSNKTKTGLVLGTPSYMSPEQLSGKRVDGRTDLYSLGIMFFQLLCGELPFKGESMASLMFKITNESHTDISMIRPELAKKAPCTLAILDKALAKAPEKRYQTGAEFAMEVRKCLKNIKKK